MQISEGVDISELEFNAPADFGDCQTVGGTIGANCIFHPDGGSATHVPGSADVMASGNQTDWVFSSMNEINEVGRTVGAGAASATTAEVIAFLPGIRLGICQRINDELGITGIPTETGIDFSVANSMVNTDGSTPPGIGADGDDPTIGEGAAAALDGQAFGCFQQVGATPDSPYVYYHALIEQ